MLCLPRIKISILLQHLQVWKVVVIKREQTLLSPFYNRMGQRGMSATEVATERGQFAVMFDENDNIDADAKNITSLEDAVQFRMKKKGETAEVAEQQIRQTIAAMRNPELVKNSQTFVQDRTSFRASAKNYQTLSNSIFRGSAADNQFLNEERSGVGTVAVPEFVSGVEVDPNKVKVEPAPQQSQVMKKVSQQVSQPARTRWWSQCCSCRWWCSTITIWWW